MRKKTPSCAPQVLFSFLSSRCASFSGFRGLTRRLLRGGMRFSVPDRQRRNKIPYLFPKTECCPAMPSLKTSFSSCHCARLFVSLHKIGCCPAMPKRKTSFLSCHCARLFLSLHKIGCCPAMPSLKTSFSPCHCARLSLSLHKIGCGSAMSSLKTSFSSCHCARLSLSLDK